MENEVKLTKLARCAGCGAKVGAGVLAQLLEGIRVHEDPNLLVGFDKSDDASVYKVSDDLALVQTVDFFPPIADDPYLFGQIAATNALSDVYAMGGEPKLALNLMCVPEKMPRRRSIRCSGGACPLYTFPSPRDSLATRIPSFGWKKTKTASSYRLFAQSVVHIVRH